MESKEEGEEVANIREARGTAAIHEFLEDGIEEELEGYLLALFEGREEGGDDTLGGGENEGVDEREEWAWAVCRLQENWGAAEAGGARRGRGLPSYVFDLVDLGGRCRARWRLSSG